MSSPSSKTPPPNAQPSNAQRPRVMIVAETFFPHPGGSERVVHNLAWALARSGWAPAVFTPDQPDAKEFDAGQPYQVIRSKWWARLRAIEARGGASLNRLSRLLAAGSLFGALLRRRWDVLIAAHALPLALPAPWLRRIRRRPIIAWVYGEDLEMYRQSSAVRWQFFRTLRAANRVVAISGDTRRALLEAGIPDERLLLLWPTPDETFFAALSADRAALRKRLGFEDAAARPERPGRKLALLTVARLVERKGVDTVLHALASLSSADWEYRIAGAGPDRPRLEALAASFGLAERVRFLGSPPMNQLLDLYEASDLFLMPNRRLETGEQEGFGIVFVEAALRGTPSIGGRSGGTSDAIAEGKSGWLVAPNDPPALAELLGGIFARPAILDDLRPQARQWAVETFRDHLEFLPLRQALSSCLGQ